MCLSSACIAPFGLKEACVLFLQESWKHLNFGRFWFAQSNSEKTSAGQVDLADSNFHSHLSNTLTLADWFPMRPSWLLTVVLAWANEHSTDRRPFVYRAECLRKALKSAGLSCESWQIYQLARYFFLFFFGVSSQLKSYVVLLAGVHLATTWTRARASATHAQQEGLASALVGVSSAKWAVPAMDDFNVQPKQSLILKKISGIAWDHLFWKWAHFHFIPRKTLCSGPAMTALWGGIHRCRGWFNALAVLEEGMPTRRACLHVTLVLRAVSVATWPDSTLDPRSPFEVKGFIGGFGAENTIWSWTTLFVIYLSFFIIFVLLLSGSQGTPWQSACEACSPGKYMLSTQSSECLSCDRGKFRTSDIRLYSMWTSDPFEMWRFRCFLVKGIQSQPKATSPRRLHATRALLVNSAGRMRGHVKNVRLAKKRRLGWEGVLRRKMGKSRVEHPAHLVLVGVKGPLPVWIFFWG